MRPWCWDFAACGGRCSGPRCGRRVPRCPPALPSQGRAQSLELAVHVGPVGSVSEREDPTRRRPSASSLTGSCTRTRGEPQERRPVPPSSLPCPPYPGDLCAPQAAPHDFDFLLCQKEVYLKCEQRCFPGAEIPSGFLSSAVPHVPSLFPCLCISLLMGKGNNCPLMSLGLSSRKHVSSRALLSVTSGHTRRVFQNSQSICPPRRAPDACVCLFSPRCLRTSGGGAPRAARTRRSPAGE